MDILETDLAEFILQVADWDEPSHIVFPALLKNRDQIREIFAKKLGYEGDNNPVNLARCARDTKKHARDEPQHYLKTLSDNGVNILKYVDEWIQQYHAILANFQAHHAQILFSPIGHPALWLPQL